MFILKAALVIISSRKKYLLAPRFPHKFLPNPGVSNMTDQSCFPPLSLSLYLIFLYIFIYLTGGKCPSWSLRHVFCLNKPLHYMMTPLSMLKNNLLRCSMCGFSSITLHCAVFELGHAISFFSFSSFLLHEVRTHLNFFLLLGSNPDDPMSKNCHEENLRPPEIKLRFFICLFFTFYFLCPHSSEFFFIAGVETR